MNFEMIGKLNLSKETDKFKPYSVNVYDSGWKKTTLKLNAICGDNRHVLQIDAGCWNDGHGDIYTFTKATVDESGNKTKGQSITIPFKERLISKRLPEVADFKKFVFDLEEPGRRYKLKNMVDALREGNSITDEQLKEVGLTANDSVVKAYEESVSKHHEFIFEGDFIDFIKKVIDSGEYKNRNFLIRGNGNYSYNENTKKVYENYIPTRIYLAADNAEQHSTATINLLFNSNSLDDMSVVEKGKYFVNGWIMEYDNNRKGNIPVPTTVAFTTEDEKKAKVLVKRFTVEDESIKELGLEVNMLNGAQRMEITEDMLTEEQKEELECGLITMNDIRAELGGSVYGDRIQEYQVIKFSKGFTKGAQSTAFTLEDMEIHSIVEEATSDLFDDDDEI